MTLQEKVGQMILAERKSVSLSQVVEYFVGGVFSEGGSYPGEGSPAEWADMTDALRQAALTTRLAIPLIYGSDAVHGQTWARGAVISPHNIGLGASKDPELVTQVARITAEESRATGVDWTFSPVIAAPQDERWGRTYEGFGEDPALAAQLGAAAIRGYQGTALGGPRSILATAKHFAGDGATLCGTSAKSHEMGLLDQGNVVLDEASFRRVAVYPYLSALAAGVGSVMASYSSYQGVKLHGHTRLLTEMLKGELGFAGFVVSDFNGIFDLGTSRYQQVVAAVNAGIDVLMLAGAWTSAIAELKNAVQDGAIPASRVDDAVRRVLTIKCEMGLLAPSYTSTVDRSTLATFGSQEHRAIARRAVQESVTVLKNEGVLPLPKAGRIHVAGSAADSLDRQCGGWTMTWQGQGSLTSGTTILAGIREVAGAGVQVTYSADGAGAEGATAAIVVLGEAPYAEWRGDRSNLDAIQSYTDSAALDTMQRLGIPTVVVLVAGRPLILTQHLDRASAWVAAWLPGTEGAGVADVLFGDAKPSGTLSHSWPARMEQIPINLDDPDYRSDPPLFAYGHGLTFP